MTKAMLLALLLGTAMLVACGDSNPPANSPSTSGAQPAPSGAPGPGGPGQTPPPSGGTAGGGW